MKPGSFPCCFSNEYVPYCCDNEQEKGNRKKEETEEAPEDKDLTVRIVMAFLK